MIQMVLCGIEIELFGSDDKAYDVGDLLPLQTYANAYPKDMYVFGKVGSADRVVLVEDGKVVTYSDLTLQDESVELKYISLSASGEVYTFRTSSELLSFMHYENVYDTYFVGHVFGSSSKNLLSADLSDEERTTIDLVLYKGLYELGERYVDYYFLDSDYRNGLIGDILDVTSRFVELDESDELVAEAGKKFMISMRAFKGALDYHGEGHVVDKFAEDIDAYVTWDREHANRFEDRDDVLRTLKSLFDRAFDRLSKDSVSKAIEIEILELFG